MRRSSAALLVGLALVVGGGVGVGLWLRARDAGPAVALSARPEVAGVVARYQQRWPEPTAPAAAWRAEARAAWAAGLGRKAARALEQALAQEVTAESLAWLVAVSARWPALADLTAQERSLLAAVVAETHPGAAAWQDLALGAPGPALARLEVAQARDRLALSARLRAVEDLAGDPTEAALALHRAVPEDVEGCEAAARAGQRRGELSLAEEVIVSCEQAGVRTPLLMRTLGDVLDAAGEPAEACRAYLAAGADLHAAAIWTQEPSLPEGACGPGGPDGPVARALAQDSPEARLHATWAAVLQRDTAAALRAVEALQARGEGRGPPFRAAAGAALLLAGRPDPATQALGALDDAASLMLRARAAARPDPAHSLARAAVDAAPWSLPLRRQQVALLADPSGGADPALDAALEALALLDPVPLALAGLEPDRLVPIAAVAPSPWPLQALAPWARVVVAALDPGALDPGALDPGALDPGALDPGALDPRAQPAPAWPVPDPQGLAARARLAGALLVGRPSSSDPADLPALADAALQARPSDPVVAALAAVALAEAGRLDPARELLARAQAQAPDAVATAWAEANLALDAGQAELARQAAERLVQAHPTLPGLRAFRYAVEERARSVALDGASEP